MLYLILDTIPCTLYKVLDDYLALIIVDSNIHIFLLAYLFGQTDLQSLSSSLTHREDQLTPKVVCHLEILKCLFQCIENSQAVGTLLRNG